MAHVAATASSRTPASLSSSAFNTCGSVVLTLRSSASVRLAGREGLLARAQELLADPPVLVPPPDGLLAEDIRRRGDSEFHEGHQ